MVAAKNRMFRSSSGKIITAQDALKAGIITQGQMPKTKEDAINLANSLDVRDREKLLEAASDRVGFLVNDKTIKPVGVPKDDKKPNVSLQSKRGPRLTRAEDNIKSMIDPYVLNSQFKGNLMKAFVFTVEDLRETRKMYDPRRDKREIASIDAELRRLKAAEVEYNVAKKANK